MITKEKIIKIILIIFPIPIFLFIGDWALNKMTYELFEVNLQTFLIEHTYFYQNLNQLIYIVFWGGLGYLFYLTFLKNKKSEVTNK